MELQNTNISTEYNDDFSIQDLIEIFKSSKRMIVYFTAIFFLAGWAYSFFSPNIYTSDSLLAIVDDSEAGGSGFDSVANRYGGLASLAGVSLATGSSSKSDLVIATIKSRAFFERIASLPGMYPSLVAVESYDPVSKKLNFDSSIYDPLKDVWIGDKPSILSTHYEYFLKKMTILADKKTGFINLQFNHASPEVAFKMVQNIIHEANDITREQHIEEANKALLYLNSELKNSLDIGTKESISTLINAQFKVKMLANVREDYVLRAIDAPVQSEWPSAPNRKRMIIITTLAGLILGLFVATLKHYFQQSGKKER